MARCYANENFPLPVVIALRELGHDVLTTLDVGKAGVAIPDDEVLRFAHEQSRAVLTFNRKDFIRLHRHGKPHSGIVVCRIDIHFAALAQRIHVCLTETERIEGQLLKVNRPTTPQ